MQQPLENDAVAKPPWALAALSLSVLSSSLGTSIANVALPTLADAFDASFQAVQWVVLAYLLAMTTLIVSVGRLGDIVGRRRLLLGGLVLFTGASVACGLAPTLRLLIAARFAQGLGAAMMMTLAMALLDDAVPKSRRGAAMGLLGTMSAAGTALGPSLGGLLIAAFGWRAVFIVGVLPGIAAFLIASRDLAVDRRRGAGERGRFDAPGSLLLAVTIGAFALAMTAGGGSGALKICVIAAAFAGAAAFALVETRTASPLIPADLIRDPAIGAGLATSLIVSTVIMANLVVGPFYLSAGLGLRAASVGLILSIGPAVAALTGVPAGRLVDGIGTRRTALTGLAAMTLGCAALALLPGDLGIAGYVAPIVAITGGYALFQTANNSAVMAAAGPERRGIVSGLLNLSRNLGLIAGAAAMGALFAGASSASDVATAGPAAVADGMRITFLVATLLILVAVATAAVAGRRLRFSRPRAAPSVESFPSSA